MSTRKTRKARRSLIQNSPLLSARSSGKSKNSVAFEFESEPLNSSYSSVFTDSEDTETKKKKTTRKRKLPNADDLVNCFSGKPSTDSTSGLETPLVLSSVKKGLPKTPKSAARSVKSSKKNLFTLPDISSSLKSDNNGMLEEKAVKKTARPKKIRHTQDLNAFEQFKRDSDIAVKPKSKKTKKARLPSFLPPVDIIDESVKLNILAKSNETSTDSDNKENESNYDSTGFGEYLKKTKKSRSRKAKNKLLEIKIDQVDLTDDNKKPNVSVKSTESSISDSDHKENDINTDSAGSYEYSRQSQRTRTRTRKEAKKEKEKETPDKMEDITKSINKSKNLDLHEFGSSKDENNLSKTKGSIKDNVVDHQENIKNNNVASNTSRRGSFIRISLVTGADHMEENKVNGDNDENSQRSQKKISMDQKPLTDKRQSKRNTFDITTGKTADSPNKRGGTNVIKRESINKDDKIHEDCIEMASGNSTCKKSTTNIFDLPKKEQSCLDSSSLNKNVKAAKPTRTSGSSTKSDSNVKTPRLKREGTFEVLSKTPQQLFQEDLSEMSDIKEISVRDTYDVVPPSKSTETRGSRRSTFNKSISTIDLTESVMNETAAGSDKKLKRSTFNKDSSDTRKSSFDFSFNVKPKGKSEKILDDLNITRPNSRKTSLKKSSTGLKYSTGSEDGDKMLSDNFVTLRRGCNTMIEFDTGESLDAIFGSENETNMKRSNALENLNTNGSGDKSVRIIDSNNSPQDLQETATKNLGAIKKTVPRKSILKRSVGASTRSKYRDTFEAVECYYDSLEHIKRSVYQEKPTVPPIAEASLNVTKESENKIDIFDLVSKTPTSELGKMMIGSGESVLMGQSFLNDETNLSIMPRLTRKSTFTKDEDVESVTESRRSTRKRWSQVEKTPIFDKLPVGSPAAKKNQSKNSILQTSMNGSRSITIRSSPDVTPKKHQKSMLKTTTRETKGADKGKKSVKIESPLKTPKIRLHSPLAMRKTPGPVFGAADNSILTGNCAYTTHSPPSCTSTPFNKKKEVSLLQKVLLTNEKNKSAKILGKSSVKTKMPNFAKIHQRQYEKMENLKEMQERKAVRAQFLLSGTKPPANTSAPGMAERESRKQLKFSPAKAGSSKNIDNISTSKSASKPVSKPLQHMLNKRASLEKKKKKEIKSRVPVPTFKPAVAPTGEPKETKKPEPKVFTRFGFKIGDTKEKVTKDQQIKAVITKSKVPVNRTEQNRSQLGGVRSNRRFELLMKMRQNQK